MTIILTESLIHPGKITEDLLTVWTDIDRDRARDRLGERDVSTQKVSEVKSDKEMSAMMRDYNVEHSEGKDERSPLKLELTEQYREYMKIKSTQSPNIPRTLPSPPSTSTPPLSTVDISSVRFRPVPVRAQAVMTSTHGHTRLIWPVAAKVNNTRPIIGDSLYATIKLKSKACVGHEHSLSHPLSSEHTDQTLLISDHC